MSESRKIPKRVEKAYNKLKAMNISVKWAHDMYDEHELPNYWFAIFCEGDTQETTENVDYYSNYWGSQQLQNILKEGGLYHEWENAVMTTVQDL